MIVTTFEKSSSRIEKRGTRNLTDAITDLEEQTAVEATEMTGTMGDRVATLARMNRTEDQDVMENQTGGMLKTEIVINNTTLAMTKVSEIRTVVIRDGMLREELDTNRVGSGMKALRMLQRIMKKRNHRYGTESGAATDKLLIVIGTGGRGLNRSLNGWIPRNEMTRSRLTPRKNSNGGRRV